MYKTIMDVEGMMCGNCEKHMNEMIQEKFDKLKAEVAEIGYKVIEIEVEPYEKKKFSLFHK